MTPLEYREVEIVEQALWRARFERNWKNYLIVLNLRLVAQGIGDP